MTNSDRDPETGISLVDGPVENPDGLIVVMGEGIQ